MAPISTRSAIAPGRHARQASRCCECASRHGAQRLLAALAGLLYAGRLHGARYTLGEADLLTVIAAVIVGGTRLNGGSGTIIGALIGSLLMGILNNGLILMGYQPSEQMIVRGLIILIAVALTLREPTVDRRGAPMFLDLIRRRNPRTCRTVDRTSPGRSYPANTYVVDLDAVEANARGIAGLRRRLGLKAYRHDQADRARNGDFCRAVQSGGIANSVCRRHGVRARHAPRRHGDRPCRSSRPGPEGRGGCRGVLRTRILDSVQSEKATEAAAAARKRGMQQPLLARIQAEGDRYYRGHEGGFEAADVVAVADRIDRMRRRSFAGITTFPALLFDQESAKDRPDAEPCHAAPRRGNVVAQRPAGDRDQHSWDDVVCGARGLGGRGRDAGRAGPRPDWHDTAPRASRT